jgi:hypothetical protein
MTQTPAVQVDAEGWDVDGRRGKSGKLGQDGMVALPAQGFVTIAGGAAEIKR